MTAADLEQLAVYNHRSGWSKPTIRKDTINGIPALIENAIITHGNRRSVGMTLWLGGKTFQVRLIYERIPGLVDHVNKTIESIRVGPLALQAIPENQGSTEAAVDQAYRQGYIDGSQLRAEGASL
jgi:hypothetical protein